jgi:hypothetical protein
LQPLMKEMADMVSRFIGFREEAESLRSTIFFNFPYACTFLTAANVSIFVQEICALRRIMS